MQPKHVARLGAAAIVVLLVVAFGAVAAQARVAGSAQTTTVTLAGWASSPEETAALNRTIAQFERLYRSIDVDYTPISGDYDAAMLARFAANRPPDVFYVDSLDLFDYQPALEPLNAYIRRTRNWSTRPFYTRLLNGFSVNGRIYGFPKDWSPLGVIANTQMLQRAGVRAPAAPMTWGQFAQMLLRLRSTNAVPGGAPACLSLDWARILPLVYQNGGAWVNPARTRSVINSPQNRVTLTTYLGWLRSGLAQTPAQLGVGWCGEAIGKEKAAIVFEGNWIYGYLQKDFPSVRFAVYPMVRTAKGRGNLGFTASYSIGKDSPNKKGAWRLLRFLVGKQGQAVWVKNSGYLPGRSDVTAPPGRANFLREAPYARPWQFVKGFQRVLDFAGKELDAAYNGDQTVAQMLADINRETQDAIDRSR